MLVSLPFPPKILWPNGRPGNKHQLARVKKQYLHDCQWATIEARGRYGRPAFGDGKIPIRLIVYPKPYGPLPDADNCVAAAKVALDAIASQVGVNDRQFAAPTVEFAKERTGRIEVVLGVNPPCVEKFYNRADSNAQPCLVNGDRPFSGGDQWSR